MNLDIDDPWGGIIETYKKCFKELYAQYKNNK